jgi:hypothetical protein
MHPLCWTELRVLSGSAQPKNSFFMWGREFVSGELFIDFMWMITFG